MPPVGSLDVLTEPALSITMQSDFDGHATALMVTPGSPVSWAACHEAELVGFVEVTTWPPPVATHSDRDGHDTPVNELLLSSEVNCQWIDPPVGFVEVNMSSMNPSPVLWSTPTHSDLATHENPDKMPGLSPFEGSGTNFHARRPPVGLVDVSRSPLLSPATQKCGEEHETADSSAGVELLPSM
jgi:hypothetical protein